MAGDIPSDKTTPKESKDSNWLVDNVVHPFVNSAALEPWNAIASVTNGVTGHDLLPECSLMDVPDKQVGAGWLAQSVSGGVGAILPFIVAGKVSGETMRGGGRMLESAGLIESGGLMAKGLASDKLAMVVGAGAYGGAQKPGDGQTRWGDATGAVVGMTALELGNKFIPETSNFLSLTGLRNRALVGVIGGSAGTMASSYVSHGDVGSFDSIAKSGLSGGALNVFLPFAQEKAGNAIDATKSAFGVALPVRNFAAREGWSQNTALTDQLNKSPLTVARRTQADSSEINQNKNEVLIGKNGGEATLGHEVEHRVQFKSDEAAYRDAAVHLDASKPESYNLQVARQKFVDIRVRQEQAARAVENRIAGEVIRPLNEKIILRSQATPEQTYAQKFAAEADQFVKDGTYRPTTDNAGSPPYIDPETKLFTQDFDPPETSVHGPISRYATNPKTGLQVFSVMDRAAPELDSQGHRIEPEFLKSVEVTPEPRDSHWGSAKQMEFDADGAIRVHVLQGKDGFPDNVIHTSYRDSPDAVGKSPFGKVTETNEYPANRPEEPRGFTEYKKIDGNSSYTFDPPSDKEWFGKVTSQDVTANRWFFKLENGGTAEYFPNGLKTEIPTAGNKYDSVNVETVVRNPDGSTLYDLADSRILITNDGKSLNATVTDAAGNEIDKFSPQNIREQYPDGTDLTIGDHRLSNIHTVDHTFDSTIYRSPESTTQIYDENHSLSTPWGDAKRVDFLNSGFKKYYMADDSVALHNDIGITENDGRGPFSRYGKPNNLVVTQLTLPDHTVEYIRKDGSTVHEYPSDINAIFGNSIADLFGGNKAVGVASSEDVNGGLILRSRTGSPWDQLHLDFANGEATTYDSAGNMLDTTTIPSNFRLVRQFPPANYPDGVHSAQGPVRRIDTDAQGQNKLQLVTTP